MLEVYYQSNTTILTRQIPGHQNGTTPYFQQTARQPQCHAMSGSWIYCIRKEGKIYIHFQFLHFTLGVPQVPTSFLKFNTILTRQIPRHQSRTAPYFQLTALQQAPDSETSLMSVFFSSTCFRPSGAAQQQLGFWNFTSGSV